jgi:ABC-type multidrug transport system fused ATPase/permease subunit
LGEIDDFELDFTTKNFNVESLQNKIRERKAAEQKIIEERQRIYEIQRAAQAKKEEEEDQEIANKAFDVVVEGWITAKVYLDLPDKPPKPSEQLFEDIAPLLNSFFVLILYIIAICLFMVGSVAAKGHIALSVGIIVVGLFLVIFISSKEEDVRKWKNEVSEHIYLEDKMNELHQEFEALLQENHASRERQIKRFNKIISLIKQNTYREESYKKIEAYNKLTGLQLFSNPANITDMMRAFYNEHFFQDQ